MANFRDVLAYCELMDIGFSGLPYTYDNGRKADANVKVKLDRVVANAAWRDLFGDVVLCHLVLSRSDHCPLYLEIRKDS